MYKGMLKKRIFYNSWQLIIPMLILTAWSISTHGNLIKTVFIPYPEKVVTSFLDLWINQGFFTDLTVSIVTMVQGFSIGTIIGLVLGSITGFSKKAGHLSELSFDSLRQVPPYAWFPLFILWFGMGNLVKVCVISYAVFWPVFLNTRQAIRLVSREFIEVGKIFELSKLNLVKKIILPASLPGILVGIRYGAGISWGVLVFAEMLGGAGKGIGYLLIRAQELLFTEQLFAIIVIIGVIGFLIDQLLQLMQRKLLWWKKEVNQ